jgi:lactoylglutathione lyase
MKLIHFCLPVLALTGFAAGAATQPVATPAPMQLGNFSVSLAVRDLAASRAFYEKLGFRQTFGEAAQHWVVMQNGGTTIGLFQGMFPRNALTFNPRWDNHGQPVPGDDVRALQRRLRDQGLVVGAPIATPSGPANFMVTDPDGNPILFDQHV